MPDPTATDAWHLLDRAFDVIAALLSFLGIHLWRKVGALDDDVKEIEQKVAACEAAKAAGQPMNDERDRQRLAMWEAIQRGNDRATRTELIVERIAAKLGVEIH